MQTLKMSFLACLILFTGCQVDSSNTDRNIDIPQKTRTEIQQLNDQLMKAVAANDLTDLKSLMSDALLEKQKGDEWNKIIENVSHSVKDPTYKVLDEFYARHSGASGVTNEFKGDDYVLAYKVINSDTYASLLLPNGLTNDLLITAIYGRDNGGWKLNTLTFGQYSVFKRKAPEYLELAKRNYGKLDFIDAVLNIGLAKQCLDPANGSLHYINEKEVNDFDSKIRQEINARYTFPLTLNNINSKPAIVNISPQMINEGVFPMITYISKIPLSDTVALKKENELMKKEVKNVFPGIDSDKKFIFYSAYNEMPDGKKMLKHYGFVDQLIK